MGKLIERCAGVDIGKRFLMCCVMTGGAHEEPRSETRRFEQLLTSKQTEEIDLFGRAQLAFVIDVCKRSRSLSDAGRTLFCASRARKSLANDADRHSEVLSAFRSEVRKNPRSAQ